MRPSRLVNRNIRADGGRTSMRLEPELWAALNEICLRERMDLHDVIQAAQQAFGTESGRTSAVRVYALTYFRAAANEAGHRSAGHGSLPLAQRRQATLATLRARSGRNGAKI